MPLRHQLAAYSPVRADAWLRAAGQGLRIGPDPRPRLAALLRHELRADRAVLCGSGTQALQLALSALLAEAASTVVALPAYTCYDVASAAMGARASIALYDVDPLTLAPDLESFERALADGARVAVIAPLHGFPIPWEPLEALASARGALLIEDASQGHGGSWRGTPLGALGATSTISFGRGKGWSGGNGGAVLARRAMPALPDSPPPGSAAGDVRVGVGLGAQWALGRPSLYGIPRALPGLGLGETVYKAPIAPHAMTRAAAAVALAARDASLAEAAVRRANAHSLRALLGESSRVVLPEPPAEGEAGWLRLPVLLRDEGSVSSWALLERLGAARGYPTTLAELAVVRERLVGSAGAWRGAERLARTLVTLPTHSRVRSAERAALGRLLR